MNIADDRFNISNIETYLDSILRGSTTDGKLTPNVYVGTLPDTIKDTWNEMCLIDCGSSIVDEDARASGSVLILLYARPLTDGSKNVKKMSEMEVALNEIIRNANDPHYQISRQATYTDYDTKRNWHYNMVELNIMCF